MVYNNSSAVAEKPRDASCLYTSSAIFIISNLLLLFYYYYDDDSASDLPQRKLNSVPFSSLLFGVFTAACMAFSAVNRLHGRNCYTL